MSSPKGVEQCIPIFELCRTLWIHPTLSPQRRVGSILLAPGPEDETISIPYSSVLMNLIGCEVNTEMLQANFIRRDRVPLPRFCDLHFSHTLRDRKDRMTIEVVPVFERRLPRYLK